MNEEEKKAIERIKEDSTFRERSLLRIIDKLQKENELAKQALIKNCNIADERNQLLKENEELKLKEKRRITGKYGEFEIHDAINRTLSNDYIPIQKVKDKIEQYKKMLLSCNRFSDADRIKAINERILELEELLKGRKQNA